MAKSLVLGGVALDAPCCADGAARLNRAVPDETNPEVLRYRVELLSDDRAPQRARAAVRTSLAAWGLASLADDASVCVSELVTNAVRHARFPLSLCTGHQSVAVVELALWTWPGRRLAIEVRDGDPRMRHRRRKGNLGSLGGRGLTVVRELADGFGCRREHIGKTVWCRFDLKRREITL